MPNGGSNGKPAPTRFEGLSGKQVKFRRRVNISEWDFVARVLQSGFLLPKSKKSSLLQNMLLFVTRAKLWLLHLLVDGCVGTLRLL